MKDTVKKVQMFGGMAMEKNHVKTPNGGKQQTFGCNKPEKAAGAKGPGISDFVSHAKKLKSKYKEPSSQAKHYIAPPPEQKPILRSKIENLESRAGSHDGSKASAGVRGITGDRHALAKKPSLNAKRGVSKKYGTDEQDGYADQYALGSVGKRIGAALTGGALALGAGLGGLGQGGGSTPAPSQAPAPAPSPAAPAPAPAAEHQLPTKHTALGIGATKPGGAHANAGAARGSGAFGAAGAGAAKPKPPSLSPKPKVMGTSAGSKWADRSAISVGGTRAGSVAKPHAKKDKAVFIGLQKGAKAKFKKGSNQYQRRASF